MRENRPRRPLRRSRQPFLVVARNHHRFDAHAAQFGKPFLDAPLTTSFKWITPSTDLPSATTRGVPPCVAIVSTAFRTAGGNAPELGHVVFNGFRRTLPDLSTVKVDAAHSRVRRERQEGGPIAWMSRPLSP